MEMTLRWYGPGYDSVTLKQIRQIPGVKNVITTLFGKQAGELWLPEEIAELKKVVSDAGLGIAGLLMYLMILRLVQLREMNISTIISRHYKLSVKLIFTWYAIILCQYLTGQEQNWIEEEKMDLRLWLIIKKLLIRWIRKKCSMQLKMI